jgi:hypothetical protein
MLGGDFCDMGRSPYSNALRNPTTGSLAMVAYILVFVLILSGKQVEMVDSRRFATLPECNAALAEFAQLRTINAWAVTCVQEHKA